MRDLDQELVEEALRRGLVNEADVARVEACVIESKGQLYRAQVLVRERLITTSDLLTLQNSVKAGVYECPHCDYRHKRDELPKKRGKSFLCTQCGKKVRLTAAAALSRIEVLASRDPLELSVSLQDPNHERLRDHERV